MGTDRTTLRLSDERKRLLDQATAIVADGPNDDSPRSDVIDAALVHLIQSQKNIEKFRTEYDPETIQDIANTNFLKLHYRTSIDSEWR
ncbi:MAG: hypothetical protein ABEH81_14045 [Halopenitus sp.]